MINRHADRLTALSTPFMCFVILPTRKKLFWLFFLSTKKTMDDFVKKKRMIILTAEFFGKYN